MWQGPASFQLVNNSPFQREPLENRELFIMLERSLGERNGNPLQDSCLGNPMDREAWWATVHGIAKESAMTQELNNNNSNSNNKSTRASRHGPVMGAEVSRKIFASLVEQIRSKMAISSVKKCSSSSCGISLSLNLEMGNGHGGRNFPVDCLLLVRNVNSRHLGSSRTLMVM